MINQNFKILHTASFFLSELGVSTLLIILQSLLALYQLLLHIKKSTFTIIIVMACLHFTEIRTHIPYFYFAFLFVLWSSPVEQLIKSEAAVEFKHLLFQLELNTKHNGRSFTRYSVNASENGDFNRGRKSTLANTMLKILTRATKRSWTYMRENGVDSPYLFLH